MKRMWTIALIYDKFGTNWHCYIVIQCATKNLTICRKVNFSSISRHILPAKNATKPTQTKLSKCQQTPMNEPLVHYCSVPGLARTTKLLVTTVRKLAHWSIEGLEKFLTARFKNQLRRRFEITVSELILAFK